jgi:hypothetical protein
MTWLITSCESPPHVEAFDAYFDGDLEAAKQASYSAMLFDAGK